LTPWQLHPGKNVCTLSIGGWVGPRTGLDVSVQRKNRLPLLNSPAHSTFTIHTELPRLSSCEF